jgi:hypothetical protein
MDIAHCYSALDSARPDGGPLGLPELEHDHLHAHAGEVADHPDCPVCFGTKEPVALALPLAPLAVDGPESFTATPRSESPEPAALLGAAPPRGPPALS